MFCILHRRVTHNYMTRVSHPGMTMSIGNGSEIKLGHYATHYCSDYQRVAFSEAVRVYKEYTHASHAMLYARPIKCAGTAGDVDLHASTQHRQANDLIDSKVATFRKCKASGNTAIVLVSSFDIMSARVRYHRPHETVSGIKRGVLAWRLIPVTGLSVGGQCLSYLPQGLMNNDACDIASTMIIR